MIRPPEVICDEMSERHKAPTFKLEPHVARIMEALLYLISQAEERKLPVTQYSLVKALFLADKSHLNRFGRPITFDNYVAMDHGPVPSFAYSLLKQEINLKAVYGIDAPLWDRKPAPEVSKNAFHFVSPKRKVNFDILSGTDVDALSDALTVVSRLSFSQLRKITHGDPAYVDAWEDEADRKSFPMSYGLIFDVPDFDQAENIALASKHS